MKAESCGALDLVRDRDFSFVLCILFGCGKLICVDYQTLAVVACLLRPWANSTSQHCNSVSISYFAPITQKSVG